MTMKTTKTLMLAGLAALSLGVGTAMAQDGPSSYFPDYQAAKILAARQVRLGQVQSGTSDVNSMRAGTPNGDFQLGWFHATPDRGVATVGNDGSGG
jgi:hypothetical protein